MKKPDFFKSKGVEHDDDGVVFEDDQKGLDGVYVNLQSFRRSNGGNYAFHCEGPSLTKQEYRDECDVNVIMARYEKTGVYPMNNSEPVYLDVSNVPDLQEAYNFMQEAEAAFMRLPAKARYELGNDPRAFVAFAQDPGNIEKMREWDLAPPAPLPEPASAPAAAAQPAVAPVAAAAPAASK